MSASPSHPDDRTVRLVVLWTKPDDAAGFDREYDEVHLPLARAVPGLMDLRPSVLRSATHHRMAELVFADQDALRAGMRTPEGAALAADAERLATAYGVTSTSHLALAATPPG